MQWPLFHFIHCSRVDKSKDHGQCEFNMSFCHKIVFELITRHVYEIKHFPILKCAVCILEDIFPRPGQRSVHNTPLIDYIFSRHEHYSSNNRKIVAS